ncbi:unnamed protein product [Paramecium sonneborni]|uniref:Uncharacterized protein n=1 Tax=Paramecium sonneborni TaxID=65129 RepID=A0A8S1RDV2_9CILI|nr:unnamed protein product [Paramecium sonneborni]
MKPKLLEKSIWLKQVRNYCGCIKVLNYCLSFYCDQLKPIILRRKKLCSYSIRILLGLPKRKKILLRTENNRENLFKFFHKAQLIGNQLHSKLSLICCKYLILIQNCIDGQEQKEIEYCNSWISQFLKIFMISHKFLNLFKKLLQIFNTIIIVVQKIGSIICEDNKYEGQNGQLRRIRNTCHFQNIIFIYLKGRNRTSVE